jgi:alpha-tubulin suppressor-like RCC1 family protein
MKHFINLPDHLIWPFTLFFLACFPVVKINAQNDPQWMYLSAGYNHALGIKSDSSLWGWGHASSGEFGTGIINEAPELIPIQIGKDKKWMKGVAGGSHSLFIDHDSTLWGCGNDNWGQLGVSGAQGSQGGPMLRISLTHIDSIHTWKEVAAGATHTIAIRSDGTLWGCGYDADGELGDGQYTSKGQLTQIGVENQWKKIASKGNLNLALKSDGSLWYWGYMTSRGPLGSNHPVQVGSDKDWTFIAVGDLHFIALKTQGTLWAWGDNEVGQVGDSTLNNRLGPVQIGSGQWTAISAGKSFSLALKSDGTLWGWGLNTLGILGPDSIISIEYPMQITTGYQVKEFVAGGDFVLVVGKDRKGICGIGDNQFGELGNGNNQNLAHLSCNSIEGIIEDQKVSQEFIVFPNPAQSQFSVQANTPGSYMIVDEMGNISDRFLVNRPNELHFSPKNMNPGLYSVVLVSDSKSTVSKVILFK